MDRLPPTIANGDLLNLLGRALADALTPQAIGELRLRFFRKDFSWQALVDLAVEHEVLVPLIFALNQRSLLPPIPSSLDEAVRATHVTSRLAVAYGEHLDRQADLRAQLEAALAALNGEGIIPVLLKGAVHLTITQPEWHTARGMRDLDILVCASEAENANRILTSLGYHPDPYPPPLDRHLPELRLPGRAGAIEIHTEALSFPARYALSTDEVRALAERRSLAAATFRALPPEWHLLHGLLHHQLADRGHARRMLAIKGLWEFSRVGGEVSSAGWRAIIDHAKKRQLIGMLSSWSIQANRLFGLEPPQELLNSQAGREHAEATFRRACSSYGLRQALFVADKLRFAFAPETLALRYGEDGNRGAVALRHLRFLWRRRSQMARRWMGR